MELTVKDLKRFTRVTFPYVNKTELSRLYHDIGFDRVSTNFDNTVMLLLKDRDFAYRYGLLVRKAVEGREFQQALRLGKLDYMTGAEALREASGVSSGASSASGQPGSVRGGGALAWLNSIVDLIGAGTKAYDTVKGTPSNQAEAYRLMAEAELARQQSRSNLGLILGIAGAIVVLVIVIVLMRRK